MWHFHGDAFIGMVFRICFHTSCAIPKLIYVVEMVVIISYNILMVFNMWPVLGYCSRLKLATTQEFNTK